MRNIGWVILTATLVCNNSAGEGNITGFVGSGLYNTGTGYLTDGTKLVGNQAPAGTGRTIYNGGTLICVLPAPLGHHVLNGFLCELQNCEVNLACYICRGRRASRSPQLPKNGNLALGLAALPSLSTLPGRPASLSVAG